MILSDASSRLPKERAKPFREMAELLKRLVAVLPDDGERLRAPAGSYARWWNEEFSREHDPCAVPGESNVFRESFADSVNH